MRHLYRSLAALVIITLWVQTSVAQELPAYAITDVTIHNSDGSVMESATVVWRDGIIEAVGENVTVPFDAFVTSMGDSLHLYPGFITGLATWGSPKPPRNLPKLDDPGNPPYDRAGIQPERVPTELMEDDKSFESAMKAGFTTAAIGLDGNMLPGQIQVLSLAPEIEDHELMNDYLGLQGSFDSAPGGWSSGAYPSTQMGVMATYRQLMYDAKALQTHIKYSQSNPEMPAPERNAVLESLFPLVNNTKPLYFEVDTKEDIERLFRLQDEFKWNIVIVSGKEAYAKAEELKSRKIPVLVSFDIADAPGWYKEEKKKAKKAESDTTDTEMKKEELSDEEQHFRDRQLKAWTMQAKNIRMLLDTGVKVGFTTQGTSFKNMAGKIEVLLDEGELTEEEIIQIMTSGTAQILGINKSFGKVAKGMNASFTLFDKPVFEKKSKAVSSVSNGTIHEF